VLGRVLINPVLWVRLSPPGADVSKCSILLDTIKAEVVKSHAVLLPSVLFQKFLVDHLGL
jgi:hypothetical protein